jgi:hypothetical protein
MVGLKMVLDGPCAYYVRKIQEVAVKQASVLGVLLS